MSELTYLAGYPESILSQVEQLLAQQKLTAYLQNKYPKVHEYSTEKRLYDYVVGLQRQYLKKSAPLSKVCFDGSLQLVHRALGLHTYASRVQGNKLKAKHEIRIGKVFQRAPLEMLRMIVVHELAHLKEKDHNKSFYQLCCHMEPNYHQLELDTRLYLTHLERIGPLYA